MTKEMEDEKKELVKLEKIVKEESTTTTTSAQSILVAEQQERQARGIREGRTRA